LGSFVLVDHFKHHTEKHMDKGNDHGYFHFEGILKIEAIFCGAPLSMQDTHILRPDDLHAKELIINETAVDAHEGHHKKDNLSLEGKAHTQK
jgi:hypothetical protein